MDFIIFTKYANRLGKDKCNVISFLVKNSHDF